MDPYNTLGVEKNATIDDIKTAYRKLAGKHHPDRGGDTKTFQEIQQAYDILSDPAKKQQFDFQQHQQHMFGNFGGFPGQGNFFADFVNQFTRQTQQRIYTVNVFLTLEQIARNIKETIQINTGQGVSMINIDIPPGVEDGSQFRYNNVMPDGWLQITFRIYRHEKFEKHGLDLVSKYDINVLKLITGTSIVSTDILGNQFEIYVPAMTKPGSKLRVSGRGLPGNGMRGDQYILLNAVLPDRISNNLLEVIKQETK